MTSSVVRTADVVNSILGIEEDSSIAQLRSQKQVLVDDLQDYYLALFEPVTDSATALPVADRYLLAIRVASHTGSGAVADWYANLARAGGATAETVAAARDISTTTTDESPVGAALRHADLITTQPDHARPSDLDALKLAGFTPAGIVALSQTIAFVSYQVRLIAGLRALGEQS